MGGIAARRVAALRVVLISYLLAMVMLGVLTVVVGGTSLISGVLFAQTDKQQKKYQEGPGKTLISTRELMHFSPWLQVAYH